ncbi:MAG TPA: hypothetical protein EYH20_08295 [Leucothrix sp.]|nr:hypothetical protein [Leucothrix sp.]
MVASPSQQTRLKKKAQKNKNREAKQLKKEMAEQQKKTVISSIFFTEPSMSIFLISINGCDNKLMIVEKTI